MCTDRVIHAVAGRRPCLPAPRPLSLAYLSPQLHFLQLCLVVETLMSIHGYSSLQIALPVPDLLHFAPLFHLRSLPLRLLSLKPFLQFPPQRFPPELVRVLLGESVCTLPAHPRVGPIQPQQLSSTLLPQLPRLLPLLLLHPRLAHRGGQNLFMRTTTSPCGLRLLLLPPQLTSQMKPSPV